MFHANNFFSSDSNSLLSVELPSHPHYSQNRGPTSFTVVLFTKNFLMTSQITFCIQRHRKPNFFCFWACMSLQNKRNRAAINTLQIYHLLWKCTTTTFRLLELQSFKVLSSCLRFFQLCLDARPLRISVYDSFAKLTSALLHKPTSMLCCEKNSVSMPLPSLTWQEHNLCFDVPQFNGPSSQGVFLCTKSSIPDASGPKLRTPFNYMYI